MGEVFLAHDRLLDRDVVLKRLRTSNITSSRALEREAASMAQINHQNVAIVHSLAFFDSTPVVVQEYLPGGTLQDRLGGSGALVSAEFLNLVQGLCDGLGALHARGYVHRDVKPSNIGYGVTNTPKLIDFGLAQLFRVGRGLNSSETPWELEGAMETGDSVFNGGLAGTPLYMSPEALRTEEPNASFDVWSVSVVIFEALTGKHPFRSNSGAETNRSIIRCLDGVWRKALTDVFEDNVPVAVEEIFSSCFHPEHSQRPQQIEHLAEIIASFSPSDLAHRHL